MICAEMSKQPCAMASCVQTHRSLTVCLGVGRSSACQQELYSLQIVFLQLP